ncbi:ectoine synthase [Chelativorans sp. Marseille-P2723]|uniref:ectoine synthase n=1 Tax=Chelativorans sp. Marseille-P2723 TaxID=2709133 RepID=UPI0015708E81|nr:ectoine synthase [Chelativorans sp. Marseille-P2723]
MIVRDLNEARNTERHVFSKGWDSVRLLLKSDGMGFSFHITTIHPGAELPMHYKNHVECVYCIDGTGSIEECTTGKVHQIRPGIVYALDKNDKHILRCDADKPMIMACVFNPPVTGKEVHQEDGSYALEAEEA